MTKKDAEGARKQGRTTPGMSVAMQQLMLPLMVALEATKEGLLGFVQQIGLYALQELFAQEAAAIAGPKGKHCAMRTHHHWGTAPTPLPFGGRNVVVPRPRVRRKGGGEVELPSVAAFREADPIPARVAEQVVLGVSTRGYERSLEPVDAMLDPRGAGKSSASRALIESTTEKLAEFVDRPLGELKLIAMFIDGIAIANQTVLIAMGVDVNGTKMPIGVWAGSTENAAVATAMLQSMIDRGLRVDDAMLFVIDGAKGLRKALRDVFGTRAVVQRCQVHKLRNVRAHVSEARINYVVRQMRSAYKMGNAKTAKRQLVQLASWLESNGEYSAAESLREGLDETLTVLRLGLTNALCRTFSTTNAIENMNGTLRRILRNVKRWRGEGMIRRWVALGIAEAQRGFRRVKGYQHMATLVAALRPQAVPMENNKQVA
jgi:transposase-like protein